MRKQALNILEQTSRTFYIPISRLPADGLQEAVMAGYLCMRAIDQVEDHPELDNRSKAGVLRAMSRTLQTDFHGDSFHQIFQDATAPLDEVTLRIGDWALLAPPAIAPRIWEATATMADRMAGWAECGWLIEAEQDLDRYTFGVAGSVGLLLSDIWAWYNGTRTNRLEAIGFGRGLQAVNIVRNREEDLARGVDFFPQGWSNMEMFAYSRRQLGFARAYLHALPPGPVWEFCAIPLALAEATLEAMSRGSEKLSRSAVASIVEQALREHQDGRARAIGS